MKSLAYIKMNGCGEKEFLFGRCDGKKYLCEKCRTIIADREDVISLVKRLKAKGFTNNNVVVTEITFKAEDWNDFIKKLEGNIK